MARSSDHNFLLSIILDKSFQAGEIRRVILLSTVYLAITTVLLGLFYYQVLEGLVAGVSPLLFVSEDMALANDAVPTLSAMLGDWLLVMLAVNVVITIGLSVYITRRLGHPLLAIKRTLRELGNGNLDVRLRADDNKEFGELAQELKHAINSIRHQIGTAKSGIDSLQQQPLPEDQSEELKQAIENCKHALDYFQVEADDNAANQDKAA